MNASALFMTDKNCTFIAPPSCKTVMHHIIVHFHKFTPFRQAFSDIVNGNQSVTSSIARLFRISSPSKIALFVMSIYINTVKGVFGRRSPADFFKKLFIGIKTKFNSTSSIVGVRFILWILTATFCSTISTIFRRSATPLRLAMCFCSFRCLSFLKTSTRDSRSCSKMFSGNRFGFATVAFAFPIFSICGGQPDKAQNGQVAKSLSRQINNPWGARTFSNFNTFSHIGII